MVCNRYKGANIASVAASGILVPLFNPRESTWAEHFRLNGAVIEPLDAIGEVTAKVLRLNAAERVVRRSLLHSFGGIRESDQRFSARSAAQVPPSTSLRKPASSHNGPSALKGSVCRRYFGSLLFLILARPTRCARAANNLEGTSVKPQFPRSRKIPLVLLFSEMTWAARSDMCLTSISPRAEIFDPGDILYT